VFFYLSQNRNCYEKLVTEIRTNFKCPSEIQTGPQLAQCSYLRACINEAMRMSPPISSTLWREVCKGGIVVDNRYIPEGVDIGVSPYALHHNENIFPESYKFKPERWIKSEDNSSETFNKAWDAFSPFSLGTRACAGRTMAYTEISDAIARTIWSLDMKRAEGGLGKIGGGIEGAPEGYDREAEFQLEDHITCCHSGPYLQFRVRKDLID